MKDESIHLVRDVVDHEVVDVHQLPCGTVDDIELDFVPGRGFRPAALLMGPGAWQRRLPKWMATIARWLVGSDEARIAWSEVAFVGERIALRRTASELGLGQADRKWGERISRFPGA